MNRRGLFQAFILGATGLLIPAVSRIEPTVGGIPYFPKVGVRDRGIVMPCHDWTIHNDYRDTIFASDLTMAPAIAPMRPSLVRWEATVPFGMLNPEQQAAWHRALCDGGKLRMALPFGGDSAMVFDGVVHQANMEAAGFDSTIRLNVRGAVIGNITKMESRESGLQVWIGEDA